MPSGADKTNKPHFNGTAEVVYPTFNPPLPLSHRIYSDRGVFPAPKSPQNQTLHGPIPARQQIGLALLHQESQGGQSAGFRAGGSDGRSRLARKALIARASVI